MIKAFTKSFFTNKISAFLKSLLIYILLIFLSFGTLFAQEEDELYKRELTFGVNFNTNGGLIGGIDIKYARVGKPRWFNTLNLQIVGVKHPKEMRYPSTLTGNTFIFGKENQLFSIRLQYGKDFIFFRKAPTDGVKVTGVFAGGLSLGILKPYYILYQFSQGVIRSEAYNPQKHPNFDAILGTGGFFEGFDKAKYLPGLNAKIGLQLEFGTFKNAITGFETGLAFEGFFEDVLIISDAGRDKLFGAAYLSIFFGSRR